MVERIVVLFQQFLHQLRPLLLVHQSLPMGNGFAALALFEARQHFQQLCRILQQVGVITQQERGAHSTWRFQVNTTSCTHGADQWSGHLQLANFSAFSLDKYWLERVKLRQLMPDGCFKGFLGGLFLLR